MPSTVEILKQELPNYLHHIKNKNSEEAKKQYCISSLFGKIFDVASEDLDFEVPTKTVSKLRGRADTLFQNIIFEWKQDAKNSKAIDDGEIELKKYFQHFLEKEPLKKYVGIITDGIIFKPYLPIIEKNKVTSLSITNELNISKTSPEDIFYWFDNYLGKSEKIKLTSKSIKMQFGLDSPNFVAIRNELKNLFDAVRDYKDVKLKFENWSHYLEIVYGEKQKEENLFFKHTYLSTLVKLIVHLKLSSMESNRTDEILPILFGNRFAQFGIVNFSEEDFFTWPMQITIREQSSQIFSKLLLELERYDIDGIDEDVLKDLYQELVDPEVRKLLGEFYTPDWLAEKMVIETLDADPLKSVLDPACGSGTFLFQTIKFKIKKLTKKGMKKSDILKHITENVFGFDVHPLAAIISKTNYLLALRDLLKEKIGQITIPVFLSDSLKIPIMRFEISSGLNVLEFEALDKKFFFPEDIAGDMVKMDDVINNLKRHGSDLYQNLEQIRTKNYSISEDEVISNLLSSYEASIKNIQDSNVKTVLTQNAKILFELIKNNLDSIWPYILRNMYRPVSLTYKKIDLILGNPPWLTMQGMKNNVYQKFLKEKTMHYNLIKKGETHQFPHMELSTVFFCSVVEHYLKKSGKIAFVMPKAILVSSHHDEFFKFEKPKFKLEQIFDLEKTEPLFNIPSCVIIGKKDESTTFPVRSLVIEGKLENRNCNLDEAKKFLSVKKTQFEKSKISFKRSYYYTKFYQGATIVPRNLFFVDIVRDNKAFLGINPLIPQVESSKKNITKPPWDKITIKKQIDSKFLFATLLGESIVPFGYRDFNLLALPILRKNGQISIISSFVELQKSNYINASNYFKEVEQKWKENATTKSKKMTSYQRLNFRQGITRQNFNIKFKVIYVASSTYLTSSVIDMTNSIIQKEGEQEIQLGGFIAESKTYFYETNNEFEAYYLCAILNSKTVDNIIKPMQTRGLWGPRDIHKRPLLLPIPEFNKKNKHHKQLSALGIECNKKTPAILANLKLRSIGLVRSEVRKQLNQELYQIDELVKMIMCEEDPTISNAMK